MDGKIDEITDDSGFLAIIDTNSYIPDTGNNCSFEQLIHHFKTQMQDRKLLIWGTGCENTWRVQVHFKESKITGFREVLGTITVTRGQLLLTNYESLSMASQFEDVQLPEKHQQELLFKIQNCDYLCRIIQIGDPNKPDIEKQVLKTRVDFMIDLLLLSKRTPNIWTSIPWFQES